MKWFVIYTKPRQEQRAQDNLQRQEYHCYLPTLRVEKVVRRELCVVREPLFPRYLFIQLATDLSAKGWGPIRSTLGVSSMVMFGGQPAVVDDRLIEALQSCESSLYDEPTSLFSPGERVVITEGPFAGVDGIYQMSDGDKRAMVLIEMMQRPTELKIAPASLRKVQ